MNFRLVPKSVTLNDL